MHYRPGTRSINLSAQAAKGAADFLQTHDQIARLLPGITRIAALQRDCAAILPVFFETCTVLHFQSGELVLSLPTAAHAAKLKQQLPKLRNGLLQLNWQVNSIKIKVQPSNSYQNVTKSKEIFLPPRALSALAELKNTLDDAPRNRELKNALETMLQRHRKPK